MRTLDQLASLVVRVSGMTQTFTTRNRFVPGEQLTLSLVDGPFRHLSGEWRFEALGTEGSKIALLLSFVLAAGGLNLAVGGLMQVVVQHGAGAGLPTVSGATKIELIEGVEIDRDPASLDDPVPAALRDRLGDRISA